MKQNRFFLIIIFYILILPTICLAMKDMDQDHKNCDHGPQEIQIPDKHDKHDNHDEHDKHDKHDHGFQEKQVPDNHNDHGTHEDADVKHKEEDDHDGHDHAQEATIVLTDRAVEFAGLTIDVVNKKSIGRSIELPGEIGFNEDRLACITPRYPGIVKKVVKDLGETIQKGELLAVVESNESLTAYTISSPISGKIVEKNVTQGEFVREDATLFIIADLATVWVNCDVYAKDADLIEKDMEILITAVGTDKQVNTTLSYIAPAYNTTTRSIIARAVIPNTDGKWRPGTFITGKISVSTDKPVLVVSQNAVQIFDGETVVFVPSEHKNGFEPVVVRKGVENNLYMEIVSGLAEGDTFVAKGAFELKAKIVTSALGDHAGHGH